MSANATIKTNVELRMVETPVETRRVLLDISEKEAQLLANIFGNIGGAANGTRDMFNALKSVGFDNQYEYSKKHFTFKPATIGSNGFIYSGSLYIDSEPAP
jgi:hypothetical protein